MSLVDAKKGYDPATIMIYDRKRNIYLEEISLIAMDITNTTGKIIAVGNEVIPLISDTNNNIFIMSPLKYGVIAYYQLSRLMFRRMLKKASLLPAIFKPKLAVCVPEDITEVEKKAFLDVFYPISKKVIISEKSAKEITPTLSSAYSVIIEIDKKIEQPTKEIWKEEYIDQIPQGIYEIISINNNKLEYIIILESNIHRVQIKFTTVTAIRILRRSSIPDEVFSKDKTNNLRRNKLENILYEIKEGELNKFIKENGLGKTRYINIKQYLIISKYYIIEILAEKEPDICVLDLITS